MFDEHLHCSYIFLFCRVETRNCFKFESRIYNKKKHYFTISHKFRVIIVVKVLSNYRVDQR